MCFSSPIRLTIGLAVICCAGCSATNWYPAPRQYRTSNDPERDWLIQSVRFDDVVPEHRASVLFGIQDGDASTPWRWTHKKAAFRFWPVRADRATFELD